MSERDTPRSTPMFLLVMGVSGSGKTTVARLVAQRLGYELVEGDDFHPPANVAKMSHGEPLTDGDRVPWLAAIREFVLGRLADTRPVVVTCSALKRTYRDQVTKGIDEAKIVYLYGDRELIADRLAVRHGHFFPAGLLDSQLADLEEPAPDEHVLTVDIGPAPKAIAEEIVTDLI